MTDEKNKQTTATNDESKTLNVKRRKKKKPILTDEELKKKKSRKKRVSAAAFVLLLAVGAMGNWYMENSNISSKIEPLLSASETKTLGEAKYVEATTELPEQKDNEYFSSARVERQNARDESLKNLQAILDNPEQSEKVKNSAEADIARLSSNISIENKIETLVTAKGIDNCIAIVNDASTKVDVIIDVNELNDTVILQVKDIAIQQLNCSFEDVTIIQSK